MLYDARNGQPYRFPERARLQGMAFPVNPPCSWLRGRPGWVLKLGGTGGRCPFSMKASAPQCSSLTVPKSVGLSRVYSGSPRPLRAAAGHTLPDPGADPEPRGRGRGRRPRTLPFFPVDRSSLPMALRPLSSPVKTGSWQGRGLRNQGASAGDLNSPGSVKSGDNKPTS